MRDQTLSICGRQWHLDLPPGPKRNIIEEIIAHACAEPSDIVLYYDDEQFTYAELITRMLALTTQLRKKINGMSHATPVIAIYMNRSPEMVISMLAILALGGIIVPISPCVPEQRANYLALDSSADLVIVHKELTAKAIAIFGAQRCYVYGCHNTTLRIEARAQFDDDLTHILYTSGSTGKPKGVKVNASAVANVFDFLAKQLIPPKMSFLALTDFTFDVSIVELIFPLTIGGSIILTVQGALSNSEQIIRYIHQFKPSVIHATPASWYMLLGAGWVPSQQQILLSSGEALSVKLSKQLTYNQSELYNLYAPTETTIWSTYYKVTGNEVGEHLAIGQPIPNVVAYILDESMRDVNQGDIGQLYLGGDCLSAGYLNNETLTKEKFIDVKTMNCTLYATGDLVYRGKDNLIYYIGRIDKQIKIGGIRIEPAEVESVFEENSFVKKSMVQALAIDNQVKELIAFVELDDTHTKWVEKTQGDLNSTAPWQAIYNSVYQQRHSTNDWVSAFTGKPYTSSEMNDWITNTIYLINHLNMTQFLDVGCGKKMLLDRFSHKIKHYVGIDPAEESILRARKQHRESGQFAAHYRVQSADEINDKDQFNFIMLNSVIQYFPSTQYLSTVMTKLILAAKKESTIVIGDVRNNALLPLHFIEKCHAMHDVSKINQIYYARNNTELLCAPDYFFNLTHHYSQLSWVDYSLKLSQYPNDLGYYRYDVILHIDKPVVHKKPILIAVDRLQSPNQINTILNANPDTPIIVKRVLYSRFLTRLTQLGDTIPYHIRHKFGDMPKASNLAIDINHLRQHLIDTHKLHMKYSKHQPWFYLDLFFYPEKAGVLIREPFIKPPMVDDSLTTQAPYNPWLNDAICARLSDYAKAQLPIQLCPNRIITVNHWPQTLSGKIDGNVLANNEMREIKLASLRIKNPIEQKYYQLFGQAMQKDALALNELSSLLKHYFLFWINRTYTTQIKYSQFIHIKTFAELMQTIQTYTLSEVFDES